MKRLLAVCAFLVSFNCLALDLNCTSATYNVVVKDIGPNGRPVANYGLNNYMNDGAEVEIGDIYVSNRVIALSLTVDRVEGKFEVSASIKKNKKSFEGKIFTGKHAQVAKCELK